MTNASNPIRHNGEIVERNDWFTIRSLFNNGERVITKKAEYVITSAVKDAMFRWNLIGHLFVTISPVEAIKRGELGIPTIAAYFPNTGSVFIAGVQLNGVNERTWLRNLRFFTIREIAHYRQDLDGMLGNEAAEDEAKRLAVNFDNQD